MTVLDPCEVDRFTKLLGLLGSDQQFERAAAAAAAKATEFLKARALGWFDVGEMLKKPPVVIDRPAPVQPSRSHQMDARRCLQSPIPWKPHERQFLEQMADQRSRPTEKQQDWLDGLHDRVAAHMRRQADADF
jgi:hypothetical protein